MKVKETPSPQRRLDVALVERGLAVSRAQARAAIEAGTVTVDGAVARKPNQPVSADAQIIFEAPHPWVSRGGVKLAHALDAFGVDPNGLDCLDVGASTGGFTHVLLARGARRVWAIDVGHGQLAREVAQDPRVASLEGVDARALTPDMLGGRPQLVVCDASFISLAKVLPAALSLATTDARLIALFKPQFEVGPLHVGKGGLVRDAAATQAAAVAIEGWLTSAGWTVAGWTESPIPGGDGNQERLLVARRIPSHDFG
jgi:23S rRNA (cytidine1920-2'-O)/16S rRNA (cytidine1409-2'-O)-methyltransferase